MAAKKQQAEGPSRQDRAQALMEFVNKKMAGRAQLKIASDYELPFATKRYPTGLLSLDIELRGGFPAGGVSQIFGPKNAGKTYLVWQVIRQQQFYKGDDFMCLLAQTEMRADRTQARLAGVQISLGNKDIDDLDKARQANNVLPYTKEERAEYRKTRKEALAVQEAWGGKKEYAAWMALSEKEKNDQLNAELDLIDQQRMVNNVPPFTPEEREALTQEVGTIHEVHGESAEVLFDIVLKAVEQNIYHVIVIDSFGSIMSAAEAESDTLENKHFGGAAKPITEFLRKLTALLTMDGPDGKPRDVCILGINQVRDAIGQPNVEYRSTGGRALEHAKFVDLFVESGKKLGIEKPVYTSDGTKKRFVQTGKEVNWRIMKGKAGIHEGASGSYQFDFSTTTGNFYLDTVVAGVRHNVLSQEGAWIGIPNPNDPSKFLLRRQGKEGFIQALLEDANEKAAQGRSDTLLNYIRTKTFQSQGIYINYAWSD